VTLETGLLVRLYKTFVIHDQAVAPGGAFYSPTGGPVTGLALDPLLRVKVVRGRAPIFSGIDGVTAETEGSFCGHGIALFPALGQGDRHGPLGVKLDPGAAVGRTDPEPVSSGVAVRTPLIAEINGIRLKFLDPGNDRSGQKRRQRRGDKQSRNNPASQKSSS
jgi:hypothetical protein